MSRSHYLEDCNLLFSSCDKCYLSPLVEIQNAFAKMISPGHHFDHVTPVFAFLHWLPFSPLHWSQTACVHLLGLSWSIPHITKLFSYLLQCRLHPLLYQWYQPTSRTCYIFKQAFCAFSHADPHAWEELFINNWKAILLSSLKLSFAWHQLSNCVLKPLSVMLTRTIFLCSPSCLYLYPTVLFYT